MYRKPLFSWMSDELEYELMMDMLFKPYRALFEHLFQGMDLERLTRCVMQQGLCQSIHFPCRVSFSIQTIVETVPDSAVQNEEIRRFLTALRSLYQFLEWQNPQAPKRFRRHLLVDYKYLLQKKVKLTRETVAMLRDMLSACEK